MQREPVLMIARMLTAGLVVVVAALCGCAGATRIGPWDGAGGDNDCEGRFVFAEGIAGPGADQGRLAAEGDVAAREELARKIEEYSRAALAEFMAATGGERGAGPMAQEFTATLAAEVNAALLRGLRRPSPSIQPNGKVLVRYRVGVDKLNAAIVAGLPLCLAHANPFEAPPDETVAELAAFLDARMRDRLKIGVRSRPVADDTPPARRIPSWLETGRHEDYPPDHYLCAIGLAGEAGAAEDVARAELVELANTRLRVQHRRLLAGGDGSVLGANIAALGPDAITFTRPDLAGCVTVAQWYDPLTDTHYVYAAADRDRSAERLGIVAEEEMKRTADLLASAGNHQKAGNYAPSLKGYLEALGSARRAVTAQCEAAAIAPAEEAQAIRGLIPKPILVQARSSTNSLLESISLEKTGGDNQWLPPAAAPRKPFAVRATAGEVGKVVEGLPIRLRPAGPGQDVLTRGVTDADGRVELVVRAPLPGRGVEGVLVAEVDLDELAPDGVAGLPDRPRAEFAYVRRSPENTFFAIFTRERVGGVPGDGLVAAALGRRLKDEGCRLVPETDVARLLQAEHLTPELAPGDIVRAFEPLIREVRSDGYLVIVAAEATSRVAKTMETPQGPLHIADCPYTVRLLDPALSDGNTVRLQVSGTGRGAYTGDRMEAARRALADAAVGAAAQLGEELHLEPATVAASP